MRDKIRKKRPFCRHLDSDRINQRVHKDKEGYSIEGCCGGGCVVIWGIKFCPFCGEKLE